MRLFAFIAVSSAIACSASNDVAPGTTIRRPATIAFNSDSVIFVVPPTAHPNVPFTVTFESYRGGCDSAVQTDVATSSMSTEIRAFENQQLPAADEACPDLLLVDTHSIDVTFLSVGTGHVILHGQRDPGGTAVTVDRPVTVAP